MAFDYSRLRGRIHTYYRTQEAFAEAMGLSLCSLNQKLNNKSDWDAPEIYKACSLLEIPIAEIPLYFFTPDVEISQQV